MRVLKMSELEEKPMGTATPIEGWTAGSGEPHTAGALSPTGSRRTFAATW